MLLAVLNTCTKEELEETEGNISPTFAIATVSEDSLERRRVIKNKILAVGKMSRVFALLRFVFSSFAKIVTHKNLC